MCELGWKSLGVLELTALPSIGEERWVPWVREVDVLLVEGGDALYLCHWMRRSGLAALLPSLDRTVWVGLSAGSMARLRQLVEAENRPHHPPHLLLVGPAVAADRLLDAGRCVFGAADADGRCGDEDGSPGLSDGERDAGVGADERLLQRDRIRRVLGDQRADAVEDRQQALLDWLPRRGSPPPVAAGPEAPVASVDDPVPACAPAPSIRMLPACSACGLRGCSRSGGASPRCSER